MSVPSCRAWAIVPAAGRSTRMGQPKLLMPWGQHTIIEQVLAAWRASRATSTIVVVHPEDTELADVCRRAGAEVVVAASPPPDMKASVRLGLEFIERHYAPHADDAWLVAPADLPLLSATVIDRVIAAHDPQQPAIVVPTHAARRGHPVLFPWPHAKQVKNLPADAGLDRLLSQSPVREMDCGPSAVARDVDTPDDYDSLRNRHNRD